MFSRIILNFKHRSNATLRAWSYQCESILAQRSRRIQQLFTFYHQVYGPNGLKQLLRRQLQPPLQHFMLSAVGAVGLVGITNASGAGNFDWKRERLSLANFDQCNRDIEFIETLSNNILCPQCKEKQMKYCYCLVGNKKCRATGGKETVRSCRKPLHLQQTPSDKSLKVVPEGNTIITSADENAWEPYFSKDEFSIWKREERTSMYSYKVYARFDDITAKDLLHVQTDLDYRRQWDATAVKLEMVEEDPHPGTNSHLIYWEMQWPNLFSNRDYVYCRRFITDEQKKVMMVCNRGTKHVKYPAYSNRVRVTDYWSLMVIKPYHNFHEPGVHYILTYYDDPGLPIPQTIKSWVTQKQMPDFLKKMYNATKQYSCKDALEMKQMHHMDSFNIDPNNEYAANVARSRWPKRLWKQREVGE